MAVGVTAAHWRAAATTTFDENEDWSVRSGEMDDDETNANMSFVVSRGFEHYELARRSSGTEAQYPLHHGR